MSDVKPRTDQGDRAYQKIREGIAAGRYRPGERLVEADIARLASVSRTPVRQALRCLERDGVVRIERRRGASVRTLTTEQISDLYELRARLEAFACELAARRAGESDRSELVRLSDAFDAAARDDVDDDFAAVRSSNAALHHKVSEISGNPFLVIALDATIDNPLVLRAYQRFDREGLGRSALFHQLIVRSICAGDGERAGRLMTEHVLQARDALVIPLDPAIPGDDA